MLTKSIKKAAPPLNKDIVCLQRGLAYLVPTPGESNLAWASTVQSRLMQYGYMLDSQAFKDMCSMTQDEILEYHNTVIDYLSYIMGGSEPFTPLYGDFPLTVMSEHDAELLELAVGHYSLHFVWPDIVTRSQMDKPVAFEKIKYTMLKSASKTDVQNIFTDLVGANQSLAPQDVDVITWFVQSDQPLVFPDHGVPFKETLCTLAGLGVQDLPIKSPTDVLRIAVHLSGGDVSLPKVPAKTFKPNKWAAELPNPKRDEFRFKKFNRKERKYLLGLLESTNPDVAEMVTKKERWIRLGEVLHPGEYHAQFPMAASCFTLIRGGVKGRRLVHPIRSWYSRLQMGFKKGLTAGMEVLTERPGEFMRRMDWLVRSQKAITDTIEVMRGFSIAARGASNKVLYELYGHFLRRDKPVTNRTVMIKGARKRTKLPDLPALDETTVNLVLDKVLEVLKDRFKRLPDLGKVWIDPELKKIPIPTNMRSVDFTLKPTMRGSRIPLSNPNAKVVRPYFHWVDKLGTLDPDLSVTFVSQEDGKRPETLNYCHSKVNGVPTFGKSVHSGDVIARQGPCAEYVDIDIADAKSMGYRYAVIDVRNYGGGSLADMNGVFGIMEREFPEANSAWTPETVVGAQACSSTASNTLLSIVDLETMEYIFLDIDSTGAISAHRDQKTILDVVQQYSELPRFSVYHLLEMHAEARGEQVEAQETADVRFEFEDFCHSYTETAKYMGV